jgi:rod shape determining protein RodA
LAVSSDCGGRAGGRANQYAGETPVPFWRGRLAKSGRVAMVAGRAGRVVRPATPPDFQMTPFLRKLLGMNWVLVLTMYGLLAFGVLAIESAARHLTGGGIRYADSQKYSILLGSLVYFAVALVDYKWIRWLAIPFYLGSIVLLLMALHNHGQHEAVRSLRIAGKTFQPTQFGISSGIVMIAWLLQDLPKVHRWFGLPICRIGIVAVCSAVPFFIVMKMGDMGSALVWMPTVVVALLVGGVPFRYLTFLGLIGAGSVAWMYFLVLPMVSKRGPERIDLWLRMEQGKPVDITGDAYAAHNISMAVGKSGWTGLGWNARAERGSLHDKRFIPWETAHDDFIFAVIGEEQGFRGSLLLITAFALLLIQCLFIAFYSRDMSGRVLVSMIVAVYFAHIFENIGMCVLLMPITGIPLPLISYSGTFVVICMFLLGLAQSVWIHRNERVGMSLPKPA